jgi:hypothetical protein
MDFQQAVPSPTSYGAPNVFQQQGQQGGGQPAQGGQQNMGQQVGAMLQKAKQLLSSGQISADQYNQIAMQYSGGNMGAGMPGAGTDPSAGAPLNLLPGQGG